MSTEKSVEDFEGFETPAIDFFGSPSETTQEQLEKNLEKLDVDDKETKEGTEKPKKETEEDTPDIDFFGDKGGEEQPEEEQPPGNSTEKEEEEKQEEPTSSIVILSSLKQRGILDYELEDDQELTDELADQLIEDNIEIALDDRVKDMVNDFSPLMKELIRLESKGGNVEQFLAKYGQQTVAISKDLDMTKEQNQIAVIKMARQDEDPEEVDNYIEYLKSSEKLESTAGKDFDKLIEQKNKLAKERADAMTAQKEANKKANREFKKELTSYITETQDIADGLIRLTTKDKKNIPSYMADKNVTLENGNKITQMQFDLYNKVFKDKEKSVLLAKLILSDFDFSEIQKGATTKVTKKATEKIARTKSNKSGKGSSTKSFLDVLDDF